MSDELYEAMVQKIRDATLMALEVHDENCGDDKCVEPVNVIAYLAHSVGIKSTDLEMVKVFLEKKEKEHEEHAKTCTDPSHKH